MWIPIYLFLSVVKRDLPDLSCKIYCPRHPWAPTPFLECEVAEVCAQALIPIFTVDLILPRVLRGSSSLHGQGSEQKSLHGSRSPRWSICMLGSWGRGVTQPVAVLFWILLSVVLKSPLSCLCTPGVWGELFKISTLLAFSELPHSSLHLWLVSG